ncbi:hypothetical protein [Undibacterium sp. Xuan67W]|uniref:hypothetical protein n=1 Tax=Undibacterium sp. Xuan67W TaxID=3413057 RepID=UPI003BF29701
MRLTSGVFMFLLLVLSSVCVAETYNMETQFIAPIKLPINLVPLVNEHLDSPFERYGCAASLRQSLEASFVRLSPTAEPSILVKPAESCLCGVHTCSFWILRQCGATYCFAGHLHAHSIEINQATLLNDYYGLTGLPGGATSSEATHFLFDGKSYVEEKIEPKQIK